MQTKSVVDHLSEYAAYHRDRRNIAIHGAGIPLIVLALAVLLSRPAVHVGSLTLTLAALFLFMLVAFYATLDRSLAIAFAIVAIAMDIFGLGVAAEPIGIWLATGVGLFVFGWVLQFIGHAWEGKKPAFLDDIMGLAIGPLFVTAEAFFALGQKRELKDTIESRVGPTYIRNTTAKA